MRPEVREQRIAIRRAARVVADRVDLQARIGDAVARDEGACDLHHLDVGFGPGEAEALDAELIGLPVAPRLRTLVTKERTDVIQPLRSLREQLVLQERAHDRRRPLGAQRHAAIALIGERVHLFFHDVRRLADAAHEELRRLEHRRADLAVAEALRDVARVRFERVPRGRLGRIDVVRAARGGDRFHERYAIGPGRGSRSSTGMPLGSSMNAIARVPPGDFFGSLMIFTPLARICST